jgi:hypothetical protein
MTDVDWILFGFSYCYALFFLVRHYHDKAHSKAVDDALFHAYEMQVDLINTKDWPSDMYWNAYEEWRTSRGYFMHRRWM